MKDVLFHLCKINGLSASWTASASATIASWTRTVTGGSSTIRIRSRGIVTPTWIIVTVASGSRIGIISRWIGAGLVAVVGGSTVGRSVATIHLIWTITIALIRRPSSYIITLIIWTTTLEVTTWVSLISIYVIIRGDLRKSPPPWRIWFWINIITPWIARIRITHIISIKCISAVKISRSKWIAECEGKAIPIKWSIKIETPWIVKVSKTRTVKASPKRIEKRIEKTTIKGPTVIEVSPGIVIDVINLGFWSIITPRCLRIHWRVSITLITCVIFSICKGLIFRTL